MQRREFFKKAGATLIVAAVAPGMLSAEDFRKTKPAVWKVKNDEKAKKPTDDGIKEAMKDLFGTDQANEGKINLKAPEIAENGAVVPISFSTKLNASKIAVFQSANPEAAVAVFTIHEKSIPNYSLRIKMQRTGYVTIVAEADGKLYKVQKLVKVTIGGCGG